MNVDHKDAHRGLYGKFNVSRVDGRSAPGEKHEGCEYFVLDLDHDPHALPALKAYEESCRIAFLPLARDLEIRIKILENRKRMAVVAERKGEGS